MAESADAFLVGASLGDGTGEGVSAAGDLDADGFADLLVGAPDASGVRLESGVIYAVHGGP